MQDHQRALHDQEGTAQAHAHVHAQAGEQLEHQHQQHQLQQQLQPQPPQGTDEDAARVLAHMDQSLVEQVFPAADLQHAPCLTLLDDPRSTFATMRLMSIAQTELAGTCLVALQHLQSSHSKPIFTLVSTRQLSPFCTTARPCSSAPNSSAPLQHHPQATHALLQVNAYAQQGQQPHDMADPAIAAAMAAAAAVPPGDPMAADSNQAGGQQRRAGRSSSGGELGGEEDAERRQKRCGFATEAR